MKIFRFLFYPMIAGFIFGRLTYRLFCNVLDDCCEYAIYVFFFFFCEECRKNVCIYRSVSV